MLESLINKVAGLKACNSSMFSCEICKIYKNYLFYRTAPVAASEVQFAFSNESRTKTGATVNIKYNWRCSVKQGVLKNFANFTGKVAVLRACNFIKENLIM